MLPLLSRSLLGPQAAGLSALLSSACRPQLFPVSCSSSTAGCCRQPARGLLPCLLQQHLQRQQLGLRWLTTTSPSWQRAGSRSRPRLLLGKLCAQAATLEEVLQLLQQHRSSINAIAVAAAYTRAGKLCQQQPGLVRSAAATQLLQHLDQLLPSVQQQLGARELSNVIWSCAYTRHTAPMVKLLPLFLQPGILAAANSHDVSNVLWALATREQQVPQQQLEQFLAALARQAVGAAPQALSNSLWALGKLELRVHGQQQQQLSDLLAAFSAEGMLARADPQAIANVLLGMTYMSQQVDSKQLQLLLAALAVQLHRADSQHVSNTLLACARFRHVPVQLLTALQQQPNLMQRFLAAAIPQHLANTAWACATLGCISSRLLLGALLLRAVELLQQDSSSFVFQNLCNLCWAAAVQDMQQHVPAVLQLAAASSRVWGAALPEGMQQLHQVHLWLLDHHPTAAAGPGGKGAGLLQVLSQQQLEECCQAWQQQLAFSAAAPPSLFQQEVFAVLQQLPGWQVPPQQEVRTADGNFSIDIAAVTAAGVQLAVEVDGPHHFVRVGGEWAVSGPTQSRNRALAARGYTLLSIPWWQWRQHKGAEQQRDYLKRKLQALQPCP